MVLNSVFAGFQKFGFCRMQGFGQAALGKLNSAIAKVLSENFSVSREKEMFLWQADLLKMAALQLIAGCDLCAHKPLTGLRQAFPCTVANAQSWNWTPKS